MNPFVIDLGGVMGAAETGFKTHVRRQAKRGIKVSVARQGQAFLVRRKVPEAMSRAACERIIARLKRPERRAGPTASQIVREMRERGRY
jgi:hypothetical protein